MRNLLVGALALLIAASAFAAPSVQKVPVKEWNYACQYLDTFYDVSCKGLERPWAVTSNAVRGNYGLWYHGEDIVYLSPRLNNRDYPTIKTVMVHETVHYILGKGVPTCKSEEIARRAHHSYAKVPYNDQWKAQYGCNKPK